MRGAVCLAAALLLTACASDGPAQAPPALTADALETRAARSQAKVSVALFNEGGAPVEVEAVRLRSPRFEELPPTPREMTVDAGGTSGRLFLGYGEPVCGTTAPLDPVLVVTVRTPDGVREVEAPLTDRTPGLGRLHELACAAQEVTEQVQVELGAQAERVVTGGTVVVRTTLALTRRGSAPVEVTRVGGNVLFTLDVPERTPLLSLPADAERAEVAVDVRASRCDPHALTESKKELVFTFPLFARLAGGEEVAVPLVVPEPGRPALLALLQEVCIDPLEQG